MRRIQRETALARAAKHEQSATLDTGEIIQERRLPSESAAGTRPFDQDDIRAEACEKPPAECGGASVAEFHDSDIPQRVSHRPFPFDRPGWRIAGYSALSAAQHCSRPCVRGFAFAIEDLTVDDRAVHPARLHHQPPTAAG